MVLEGVFVQILRINDPQKTSTRARRRDGFVKGEPLVGHEPHREFFHRTHLLLLAAL